MIKALYGSEKTNSYRPEPWNWSTDPFPAFRGAGQRYNAFLAVANGFTPWFSSFKLDDNTAMCDDFCKIITTKKGTRLLVPCGKQDDERILLITARGGFRGGFGKIEAVGAEILWHNGSSMHCCPVEHIIARITEPDGYVRTETGRRCSSGYTEVYSWNGGYFGMNTVEYDAAVETGTLFSAHNTIQSDLERCKTRRAEQAASRQAKAEFAPRLEAVNTRLEICGKDKFSLGDTFFTENGWGGTAIRHLYSEKEVAEAETKATKAEADRAMREAEAIWQPRFKAATEGYTFTEGKSPWRDPQPEYCSSCVSIWSVTNDKFVRYEYSADGLAQFKIDIQSYEEEYQSKLRAKAEAEAKVKAAEAERRAEEERRARNTERVNNILQSANLPKRLWLLFKDSEEIESEILEEVRAILIAPSVELDEMDWHELTYCGFDRRCDAIYRVLERAGEGRKSRLVLGRAESETLAQFITER